jgi:transposase
LRPKKLLLTKWSTVTPVAKQVIAWRELQDDEVWRQGWAACLVAATLEIDIWNQSTPLSPSPPLLRWGS